MSNQHWKSTLIFAVFVALLSPSLGQSQDQVVQTLEGLTSQSLDGDSVGKLYARWTVDVKTTYQRNAGVEIELKKNQAEHLKSQLSLTHFEHRGDKLILFKEEGDQSNDKSPLFVEQLPSIAQVSSYEVIEDVFEHFECRPWGTNRFAKDQTATQKKAQDSAAHKRKKASAENFDLLLGTVRTNKWVQFARKQNKDGQLRFMSLYVSYLATEAGENKIIDMVVQEGVFEKEEQ